MMDLARLLPYVVPSGYLAHMAGGPEGFFRPLGHEAFVMLVVDGGGVCGSITPEMLRELGLEPDPAHRRAVENLAGLAAGDLIHKSSHASPDGIPFIVWWGHWLAASCLVLPNLHAWASKNLGDDDVLASVPQRETLLLFPRKDRAFQDGMRAMIAEGEKDAPKPITRGLFSLSDAGIQSFSE